jgi:hypothetical protein
VSSIAAMVDAESGAAPSTGASMLAWEPYAEHLVGAGVRTGAQRRTHGWHPLVKLKNITWFCDRCVNAPRAQGLLPRRGCRG